MNKEQLIESASKLVQPTFEAANEFIDKAGLLAEKLNEKMAAREDVDRLVGSGNLDMMKDNSRNLTRFMGSMFTHFDPNVFVETIIWVFRSYRSHGFTISYWPANLNQLMKVISNEISKDAANELVPLFDWIIVNIPAFTKLSDAFLNQSED